VTRRLPSWITGSTNPYRSPLIARISGFTQARSYNRAVKDPDLDKEEQEWKAELAEIEKNGTSYRAETIARAYDGAITRAMRVEAKAVALLQVIAIGFAIIALIAVNHNWLLRLLSLLATVYLLLATLGALEVLKVRPQQQVVVLHAKDETSGLLETALAAVSLEQSEPRATNYVEGVLRDLKIGFGASALALLLLTVIGVDDAGPSPDPNPSNPVKSAPTNSPTTQPPTTVTIRPPKTTRPSTPSSTRIAKTSKRT
jgi:hypothetical protein